MPATKEVNDLLERWEELRRKGKEVSVADLCREEPHLLPELEREMQRRLNSMDSLLGVSPTHQQDSSTSHDAPVVGRAALPVPKIAGYEILGVLGHGGMGVVYKARQLGLKRIVALKMISPDVRFTQDQIRRFRAEAEAVARFQDPHIVQVYHFGEHDGCPYFSMEFVEGGSLDKKANGKPLVPRKAAQLVEILARTIQCAHEKGIVHRDLKPANVLLTTGTVIPKITDFGLAKQLDAEISQTKSGVILGTPTYMAPEQASGKTNEIGPPADIYALGVILYELLTGKLPFKGESAVETLVQIMSKSPVRPRKLRRKVPRDLEAICMKCLEKEPAKRYASADLLSKDLRRFLAGEPVDARRIGTAERLVKWVRRRPITAALLGSFVLLGGVAAGNVWYFTSGKDNPGLITEEKFGEVRRFEGHTDKVSALAYSPDGQQILSGAYDQTVRLWDTESGKEIRRYDGHTGKVTSVAFSKDGKTFASSSLDMTIRRWDVKSGAELKRFTGSKAGFFDVALSPDGRWVLGGDGEGLLCPLDIDTGKALWKKKIGPLRSVAFSPTGDRILTGTTGGKVRLWQANSGAELSPVQGHTGNVRFVMFLADGTSGISSGQDKTIHLLDLNTGKEKRRFVGHTNSVGCVVPLPDGKRILSASADETLILWDLETGQRLHKFHGHAGGVIRVVISPDGKHAASGSADKTIRLWKLPPYQKVVSAEPVK